MPSRGDRRQRAPASSTSTSTSVTACSARPSTTICCPASELGRTSDLPKGCNTASAKTPRSPNSACWRSTGTPRMTCRQRTRRLLGPGLPPASTAASPRPSLTSGGPWSSTTESRTTMSPHLRRLTCSACSPSRASRDSEHDRAEQLLREALDLLDDTVGPAADVSRVLVLRDHVPGVRGLSRPPGGAREGGGRGGG